MKYIFTLVDVESGETLSSYFLGGKKLTFPVRAQIEVPKEYVPRIARLFGMTLLEFRGKKSDSTYKLFESGIKKLTNSYYRFKDEPSDAALKLKLNELYALARQFPEGIWEIKV